MSLFRKTELIEDDGKPDKIEEKIDENKEIDVSEIKINENLIKLIENIVEKYLDKKTIKQPQIKRSKPQVKKVKKVKKVEKVVPSIWYMGK